MPLSKKDCDSHNFESAYVTVSHEQKKHSFFLKEKWSNLRNSELEEDLYWWTTSWTTSFSIIFIDNLDEVRKNYLSKWQKAQKQ